MKIKVYPQKTVYDKNVSTVALKIAFAFGILPKENIGALFDFKFHTNGRTNDQ